MGNYEKVGIYLTSGGFADWALAPSPLGAGIKYSFTMELPGDFRSNTTFFLPPEEIVPVGEETWAFHVAAAKHIIEEFKHIKMP